MCRVKPLEIRAHQTHFVIARAKIILFAEEAARGLAEFDIRILRDGVTGENVQQDFSEILMEAVATGRYDEISRATVYLYTRESTLYRDINAALRDNQENCDYLAGIVKWRANLGVYALIRSGVPERVQPIAFYYRLLEQVLIDWPNKLGEVDVFRGVMLDEYAVDAYRDDLGDFHA
jgi:hypothetical protein